MIQAGILSDTHLTAISPQFAEMANRAFKDCDVIFHAGDLVDTILLDIFSGKTVHSVHGNMCNLSAQRALPESKVVELQGHKIAICHGAGPRHNIEDRMWSRFSDADCIIFGHTHRPLCEKRGGILFINPGSFQCTSSFSSPASYAVMTIGSQGIDAKILEISIQS